MFGRDRAEQEDGLPEAARTFVRSRSVSSRGMVCNRNNQRD